ncbi:MAG: SLC13 family permease [Candidatus Methylumidiphilus sp.]
MNISLLALTLVFLLIAARRVGHWRIGIWQAMAGGAAAVLATGQISPAAAFAAIDREVMLFLFGMFVVGQALVASGYLYSLAYRLFWRIRSSSALVLAVLFGGGLASALLMNDTLAIIGTPLVLRLAREHKLDERLMLLALAFAVTLGSAMSPIGNPQNLLIAAQAALPEPFSAFLSALGPPSLLNLALAFGLLRVMFRASFHDAPLTHTPVDVLDAELARWARLALLIVVALTLSRVAVAAYGGPRFALSWIALGGALPVLLCSRRRLDVLRQIDWQTLAFFASMFVLMASVWDSGFLQGLLRRFPLDLRAIPTVLGIGVCGNQLVSNVPLFALYLPRLQHSAAYPAALLALAAGSTLAGNLLVLGAASNVIIIQHAEKHQGSLGFFQFAKVGVPLTAVNFVVYWGWLEWFYRG